MRGRLPLALAVKVMSSTQSTKKTRVDGQVTGLAGEFFVAAELLKRNIQTSVTFGNAKAIDLLAFNPSTNQTFTVQVKALRAKNYFLINKEKVNSAHVYVFVLLNKPKEPVEYFIVPGSTLIQKPEQFGRGYFDPKLPGIHPRELESFRDNWPVFGVEA